MAATNVIWVGNATEDKLYKSSGAFTATLTDSLNVGTGGGGLEVENTPIGVGVSETDTIFGGDSSDKLQRISGGPAAAFTTTIVDSQSVTTWTTLFRGCDVDGPDASMRALFATSNKMWRLTGVFTATLSDSRLMDDLGGGLSGIAWDGANTLLMKNTVTRRFYQVSGFTSTLLDSRNLTQTGEWGIAWDTTNSRIHWCEDTNNKLMQQTGFTATVNDSRDVSATETGLSGITIAPRLGATITSGAFSMAGVETSAWTSSQVVTAQTATARATNAIARCRQVTC